MKTGSEYPACILLAETNWGSTLHAARSLGKLGVPVYIATCGSGADVYRWSRYCVSAIDIDSSDRHGYCSEVRRWADMVVERGAPTVVIPLSDRLVEYLHETRDQWDESFRLCIPPSDTTESLLDKRRSLSLAARAGLVVPPWRAVDSPADIERCMDLRFPVLIRPVSWSAVGDRYFKIQVLRSPEELERALLSALSAGATLVVQEYLDVDDDRVEFAIVWRSADRSTEVGCTGRKLRQSAPEGGVMVWGESDDLPDVREQAFAFMEESDFVGLGGIEFIRLDNELNFVEFNPRLEAIHFLATRAGIDTISMAYRDLALGVLPSSQPSQESATAWVGSACAQRIAVDRHSVWLLIRDRSRFAVAPNRVRAVWSWRDPVPSLAVARRLVSSLRRIATRMNSRRKSHIV